MAEKNTSKRPSVVGRKTKVSNASVPSASAGKPEGLFQDSSKGAAHPMPRPSVPEGKRAKSSLNVETNSVSEKTGTPRMSVKAKSGCATTMRQTFRERGLSTVAAQPSPLPIPKSK